MENILVSIDFHKETKLLIDKATELAKAFGAKIWLIHIAAPEPDFVGYKVGPQYIRDFRAIELNKEHKMLSENVAQLKSIGIDADGLLVPGATIETILEESKKLMIDLIVFGHHPHSFFSGLLFGGKSSELINNTTIPVLIVPFGK